MSSIRMTSDRESRRAHVLDDLTRADLENDPAFDRVSEVVASVCDVSMANVSLMESERQCLMGSIGFERDGWDRDVSFCTYTLERGDLMIVEDATEDDRFASNPLVLDDDVHLRFYAGLPLFIDSTPVGTVCALDEHPGELGPEHQATLFNLARHLEHHVETVYRYDLSDDLRGVLSRLTSSLAQIELLRYEGGDGRHEEHLDVLERCVEGAAKMLSRHFEAEGWLRDPFPQRAERREQDET